MANSKSLSFNPSALIRAGLQEIQQGRIEYLFPDPIKIVLATPEFRAQGFPDLMKWYLLDVGNTSPSDAVVYRERPTMILTHNSPRKKTIPLQVWSVGMSSPFRRLVEDMDRSLQARVLLMIRDLCVSPVTPRLDVCEPIGGQIPGLWGYSDNDYRLIYSPDAEQRRLVILMFEDSNRQAKRG